MKLFKVFILLFFVVNTSFAQKKYTGQSIEEILELPEEDINIGIASLVLAKEFYPKLNVQYFLNIFDYMANRFNYFFGNYKTPSNRIGALNTFLYKPGYWNDNITFTYNFDDLFAENIDNRFINNYIASKKGSCVTMPMLYIILAERLGYPIYASRAPLHYFARYLIVDSTNASLSYQNIEATSKGGIVTDKRYIENDSIPDNAITNGVYLRTLSKKEYIATLLADNAYMHSTLKNIKKAKHYYEVAISYDSTLSGAYWNYSYILYDEAVELEKRLKEEIEIVEMSYIKSVNPNNPVTNNVAYQSSINRDFPDKTDYYTYSPNQQKRINKIVDKQVNSVEIIRERNRKIEDIEKQYLPKISEKLKNARWYKKKAKDLGIVLQPLIEFRMNKSLENRGE